MKIGTGEENVNRSSAALLVIATAECVPAQRPAGRPAHISVLNKTQLTNGFCLIYLSVIIPLPFSVIYPAFHGEWVHQVCTHTHPHTHPHIHTPTHTHNLLSPFSSVAEKKGHKAASHLGESPFY